MNNETIKSPNKLQNLYEFDLSNLQKHINKPCPCLIPSDKYEPESICPCKEFVNNGKCICSLFVNAK